MNITELRALVSRSFRDEWIEIQSGPLFHATFDVMHKGGADEGRITDVDTHLTRIILKEDIDIAIEWGMRANRGESEHHPWAVDAHFPDQKVVTYFADVFYRGALVDRQYVCSVDGGRAYLPAPHASAPAGVDPLKASTFIWHASAWRTAIARLVSGDRSDFDAYLSQAKIVVEPA